MNTHINHVFEKQVVYYFDVGVALFKLIFQKKNIYQLSTRAF